MDNPLKYFFLINVCAWVQKGNKFLLAQRSKKDNFRPGEWSLPGGKVEWNLENNILEHNLQRELKEELGIHIKKMKIINNSTFKAKKFHAVNIVFMCQWMSGKAQALEDTQAVKWHTIQELMHNKTLPEWLQKEVIVLKKHLTL